MRKLQELADSAQQHRVKLNVRSVHSDVSIEIVEKDGVQPAKDLAVIMPWAMFDVLPLGDIMGKVLAHIDAKGR